jgi:hypothetical protein
LRVLYVSGYPEVEFDRQGSAAPALAFLAKPDTGSTLAHKVREVLDA